MQTKIFKIQNSQPTDQSSLFGSFLPNNDSLVISLYFLLVWNQPWPPTLLLRRPRRRTSRPSWNLGMERFFIWNTDSLSWPELAKTFTPKVKTQKVYLKPVETCLCWCTERLPWLKADQYGVECWNHAVYCQCICRRHGFSFPLSLLSSSLSEIFEGHQPMGALNLTERLPICFLTSDLTNQKQGQKNSDCETSWLV